MTNPPPSGDPSWQATPPPGAPSWQPAPPPDPAWPAGPPPVQPPPQQQSQHVWLYVVFGTVVALLVTGGLWFGLSMLGDSKDKKNEQSQVTEPEAEVDDGGIVVGDSGPKVDIYLDFICPACGNFSAKNDSVLQGAITDKSAILVFHPLNFLESASTTNYSGRAAAASVCAADDGKFFDYYRTLMRDQPPEGGAGHDDDKLIELGSEVGLDDGFAGCVDDGTYLKWIDRETEKALDSGVDSTPMIRIDGELVDTQSFDTEFPAAVE